MLTRREFLSIGAAGVAGASVPFAAAAQTAKRGGTLTLRTWDPPHFDQILAHAYKTHVVISFTHSRLLRHRAGPAVRPGSFQIEGDLAESWQQTGDTTYVFKLRKGVRFHAKPPVNGRELTADDVRYVHFPSGTYIAVWEGALKNYAPNLGYDYGGRLLAAWLDR